MSNFQKVIDLVYSGGINLKKHFGDVKVLAYKNTYFSSAVTKLDKDTEIYLKDNLKKLFPDIGFKGEEFGASGNKKKFWLVDPIDGTGLFVRGLHGCVTMLALIEDEEIKFSVIYDFVLDKLYTAEKGKGAYLIEKSKKTKMYVSTRGLKGALLHVESKLEDKKDLRAYLTIDKKCIILGNYPAGMHFAETAEGKIEGRICMDPYGKDYDFAPGQLLVMEAGGIVKNIGVDSFDYKNRNFIAANREVYRDLTEGKKAIFPITGNVVR